MAEPLDRWGDEDEAEPMRMGRLRMALWGVAGAGLVIGAGVLVMTSKPIIVAATRPPPLPPTVVHPVPEPPLQPVTIPRPEDKRPDRQPIPEPVVLTTPPPVTPPPRRDTRNKTPGMTPISAERGDGKGYGFTVGGGGGDGIGATGGGGLAAFDYAAYTRVIEAQVQAALRHNDKTRGKHFGAKFAIAISADGRVTSASLRSSSGDGEIDAELARLLQGLSVGAPPDGQPHPTVGVRVSAS